MKKFLLLPFISCFLVTLFLPLPASAADGQFIIINKASNELAYYENNKLNRIFSVATGKSPSLTPEGSFIIVNKIVNRPYYKENIPGGDPSNPLGDRWLGLNARGTWGTTYAIHGNNNPASIGRYVSLGCIRMYDNEVRWLFDQVKVNTPVIIVTSSNSFDTIAKTNGQTVTASTKGSAPAITNTILRLGSSGGEVKELQQTLKNLDYDISKVSGTFDEETEKAVKEFQKTNKILVDGIVGPQTKRAFRNSPQKAVAAPPAEEEKAQPPEETAPTEEKKIDETAKPEEEQPEKPDNSTPPDEEQSNEPDKSTPPDEEQSNEPDNSDKKEDEKAKEDEVNPISSEDKITNEPTKPDHSMETEQIYEERMRRIHYNLARLGFPISAVTTLIMELQDR